MIGYIALIAFVLGSTFGALFTNYFAVKVERTKAEAHAKEIASINKVGKWYEGRVAELENETRSLAEQVVASGSIVRHAMPIPNDPYAGAEWSYDDTGLVRERLDPRDLPLGL